MSWKKIKVVVKDRVEVTTRPVSDDGLVIHTKLHPWSKVQSITFTEATARKLIAAMEEILDGRTDE